MSTLTHYKIKTLYQNWPNHAVLTITYLKSLGYSNANIQKYINSGWIKSIGEGAYIKPSDIVNWHGAVYGLVLSNKCVHVGGKTALEEHGVAHYIKMHENEVYLFSENYKTLPKWLVNNTFDTEIKHVKTNFIKGNTGITDKDYGDFKLPTSCRERAILEFIFLQAKYHTFEECNLIMQNLSTLRPKVIQELLEICDSVRVKRTFLFLATHNKHDFVEELDLAKIDLGSGYREIVKNGVFDPKFKINYPHSLGREDENKF